MIEVGDKVRRIGSSYRDMRIGDVGIVSSVSGVAIRIDGSAFTYDKNNFELVDSYTNHKQELKI